jgi:hypothetical protein
MNNKFPVAILITLVLLFFGCCISFAASFPPPPPPPPAPTPLDGGLLALVAGGIGYAAKKYYNQKKA